MKKPTIFVGLAVVVFALVLLCGIFWPTTPKSPVPPLSAKTDPFANLDLVDPEMSYLVLRHAAETGGNERTRELAVKWLDQQTRRNLPLNAEQETWLLGKIASNGHATWDSEYRFLFFNSAFNVLHMGRQQDALARQLQKLAADAPEKTMRLYALQHIKLQRGMGHVTGPLADEVRTTLHTLASQPGSPVAGSALSTLLTWEGAETPTDPQLITLALKLAADPKCGVDVRITALHSALEHALPLARLLAPDAAQPVQLRKASIACIGRYGAETDRVNLESLRSQNFRLAQAAEPALRALQKRNTPEPVPF